MVDWNSIAVNIFSTAAIVGGISFVLKKSFEKLLDNRLKQAQEEHKIELAESQRRQAELFDKRFDSLKTAVSLVYRARNAARELSEDASLAFDSRNQNDRNRLNSIRAYHEAIEELLFEERSIMPVATFQILHDHKRTIFAFLRSIERLADLNRKRIPSESERSVLSARLQSDIKKEYEILEKGYQEIVNNSREFMGLEKNG